MRNIYPLTITKDRYGGKYSGGKWIAWHLYACDVPKWRYFDDALDNFSFWKNVKSDVNDDVSSNYIVGVGDTIEEAIQDLEKKLDMGGINEMKFVLNGYGSRFIAEAPEDITLKQLLKQCDKIYPDFYACGICSLDHYQGPYKEKSEPETEIIIGYDSIKKANDDVSCTIKDNYG